MAGPSWLTVAFAAIMIVVAVYCAGRLAAARLWRRATEVDADAVHAVMGVAMAGMLLPWLSPLPGRVWEAVFAVAAAWFAVQAIRGLRANASAGGWRCSHPVPHVVESAAMIYMLAASPGSGPGGPAQAMSMPGMGSGHSGAAGSLPALAVVLALFMVGYVLWTADQLTSLARASATTANQDTARAPARALAGPRPPLASLRNAVGSPAAADRIPAGQLRLVDRPALAPGLAAWSKIAMGLAMGYMLIGML